MEQKYLVVQTDVVVTFHLKFCCHLQRIHLDGGCTAETYDEGPQDGSVQVDHNHKWYLAVSILQWNPDRARPKWKLTELVLHYWSHGEFQLFSEIYIGHMGSGTKLQMRHKKH
ncbi:hypothetical protein A6R68_13065, partial [Neotoma lepida]